MDRTDTMERTVTLNEMLEARERRASRQQMLFARYPVPMICFTMNIAGPVKNSPLIRQGFLLGDRCLLEQLNASGLTLLNRERYDEPTGNEAYYLVDADPCTLKKIACAIEDGSLLGRLFDMDVLTPSGEKIDRTRLALPPRSCLLCDRPAKGCARSRTHTVEDLQRKTRAILTDAVDSADAADAARLALKAILYEVCTTPKPGLVDRANSGSHRDMDMFTFMDSASTLWPYFQTCAKIGRRTAGLSPKETFRQLRDAGRRAEGAMFSATKGVNTHKGAVFSMGVCCGALGRLAKDEWAQPERICRECAAMTQGLTEEDFKGLTPENARTVGQKLYLRYGIGGVRGQMEEGLPAVIGAGLPVLTKGLARGLSFDAAGCAALLALIATSIDTNLIARSDLPTQQETAAQIKALLEQDPYPDLEALGQLDRAFIAKNLSPGGSADLLAVCYLLYFLGTEG